MKSTNVWSSDSQVLDQGMDHNTPTLQRPWWWVWLTVGIGLAGVVGFSLLVLSSHQGNPRTFILETPEGVPDDQGWGVGYDGRFAYHIAVNPWGSVEGLDAPNYRYQRIMYPLVVKILSLGRPDWVPWVMLGVNIAAAWFCIFLLALLLNQFGAPPLWALTFPFSLAFLITIRMNLLEPMALAFALAGWVAYEKNRPGWAIVLFALGGLTKEIALTFPAAIALYELFRRDWRQGLTVAAGSFGPYILLYVVLLVIFGTSAEAAAKSSLYPVPFGGLRFLTDLPSRVIVLLWVVLPAVVTGVLACYQLWRRPTASTSRAAWLVLLNTGLISVLPQLTWVDPLAVLRFGLGSMLASLLWTAQINPRILPVLAILWLPSGAVLLLAPGLL